MKFKIGDRVEVFTGKLIYKRPFDFVVPLRPQSDKWIEGTIQEVDEESGTYLVEEDDTGKRKWWGRTRVRKLSESRVTDLLESMLSVDEVELVEGDEQTDYVAGDRVLIVNGSEEDKNKPGTVTNIHSDGLLSIELDRRGGKRHYSSSQVRKLSERKFMREETVSSKECKVCGKTAVELNDESICPNCILAIQVVDGQLSQEESGLEDAEIIRAEDYMANQNEAKSKDKTKKTDIEQLALKDEPKPDKGAEDLATKVNMEPVDFKKPVKKETMILLDKNVDEDGNIAYKSPGDYEVTFMDMSKTKLWAESQYDAKKRALVENPGKKVLKATLVNRTHKTYQASVPNEKKLSNFHSVIIPEHSIDPTGQRFEFEAIDLVDAEKKIKEQFGEATKIMQLEPIIRNRLGTGDIFDIMRDVKEDMGEVKEGVKQSFILSIPASIVEDHDTEHIQDFVDKKGWEVYSQGAGSYEWEKVTNWMEVKKLKQEIVREFGSGIARKIYIAESPSLEHEDDPKVSGSPHIGGREGLSPGLQKVADAVYVLSQKYGKLTPELLLKKSKDIPVLSKKIRGELSRAVDVLDFYQNAVRREKENELFRREQTERTNSPTESLYLCNSCAKTFRANESVCPFCECEDTEEIKGGNKVDEKKVKEILGEHLNADGSGDTEDIDDVRSIDKKQTNPEFTEETKVEQQLKMGIEIEKEHTDDSEEAAKIALDHLKEDPDYYTKLKKMEAGQCESKVKEAEDWARRKDVSNELYKKSYTSLDSKEQSVVDAELEKRSKEEDERSRKESKTNEAEEGKDKLKVIARGFEKKEDADAIARTKQGQVVADDAEPEKFMIISKLEEKKIEEDWDYTFKHPEQDQILSNPLVDESGKVFQGGPQWGKFFSGERIRVFTEHQEEYIRRNGGIPVREKVI